MNGKNSINSLLLHDFPREGCKRPPGYHYNFINQGSELVVHAHRALSALEDPDPDTPPRACPDSGLDAWDERGTAVVRARAWPGHVAGLRTPVRRYLRSATPHINTQSPAFFFFLHTQIFSAAPRYMHIRRCRGRASERSARATPNLCNSDCTHAGGRSLSTEGKPAKATAQCWRLTSIFMHLHAWQVRQLPAKAHAGCREPVTGAAVRIVREPS